MRAAGLHPIHTLLSSEAVLIHSSRPQSVHSALIQKVTARIAGVIAANKYVLCNYNVPRKNLDAAVEITPGRRAATVSPLDDPEWVAVSAMVEKSQQADIMDRLSEKGATDILIVGIVSWTSSSRQPTSLTGANWLTTALPPLRRTTVVYDSSLRLNRTRPPLGGSRIFRLYLQNRNIVNPNTAVTRRSMSERVDCLVRSQDKGFCFPSVPFVLPFLSVGGMVRPV